MLASAEPERANDPASGPPPSESQHRNSPAFARVAGRRSRNTLRNSSRNGDK